MKINKHIEIVGSSVPGLGSMGKITRLKVQKILSKHYTKVGIAVVNNLEDLEALVLLSPDLVFLGMKFVPLYESSSWENHDKIWLSEYLSKRGIVSTGSNPAAYKLEFSKQLAKQRVISSGLNTSGFTVVGKKQLLTQDYIQLDYPLFVKPTDRGGGLGIDNNSVVHTFKQLSDKVASIRFNHQSDALIEEYLPGREFSVAVLKNTTSPTLNVMPIELVAPLNNDGNRILTANVKSADTEIFMAVKDKELYRELSILARDVFIALGGIDYGRIDIRLGKDGTPQFLEANLIPSLAENYGNFPKACMLTLGMSYKAVVLTIVELGLARNKAQDNNNITKTYLPIVKNIPVKPLIQPVSFL